MPVRCAYSSPCVSACPNIFNQRYQPVPTSRTLVSSASRYYRLARMAWILLGLMLVGTSVMAGEADDLARLEAIHRSALTDNNRALTEARAFAASMTAETSYAARIELFKARVPLALEAGQVQEVRDDIAQLRQLGAEQNDVGSIALADIWEAGQQANADRPEEALSLLLAASGLAARSADPFVLMMLNRSLTSVYSKLGQFEKAMEHQLTGLHLAEQQPRRRGQAKLDLINQLGALHVAMKNPNQGLASFQEALKLTPEVGSRALLASVKVNQGNALAELGRAKEALAAYQEALTLSQAAGLLETEIVVLINLADHYLREQAYERASNFARQALLKAGQIDSRSSMAVARANLGFALAGLGNLKEGVQHINAALSTYHKTGARTDEEGLTAELSALYERAGLWREALLTSRQQLALSREIFRADQTRAIAGLQEQFHATQQQKQIELLARENQLKDTELTNRKLQQTVTFLGIAVTLMAAVLLALLYRRLRQSNAKLKLANSELAFHSVHDPLTGLYNRRSFLDLMKQRLDTGAAGRRQDDAQIPGGLVILDIDHFKQVNDTWGHRIGDAVLVQVAQRLKSAVRESDRVLRWGGEEFLVYSPNANSQHLQGLTQRLLQAVGTQAVELDGKTIPVTLTAGFIVLPYSGLPETVCNWERALQIADLALYLGKANGRNRGYGVGPLRVAPDEALPILDHDLSAALKAGMVELIEVFGPAQPARVNAAARSVAGDWQVGFRGGQT